MRQQAYELREEADRIPREFGSTWEMRDGDVHEPDLRAALREAGYTVHSVHKEVSLDLGDGRTHVLGHIDGIVEEGELLEFPHLFEAKSMSAMRFARVVKEGVREGAPEYYHQMQGYMEADDLGASLFVAKAKDSSMVKRMLRGLPDVHAKLYIEIIPRDPDFIEVVKERHRLLKAYHEAGVLPPQEYEKDKDWQCRVCEFRGICWNESSSTDTISQ